MEAVITTRAREAAPRQYLTRSDVARLFEVSPATIARWTREGKLAFVLTLGGQRRYARDQIIDLIQKSREGPLAARGRAERKAGPAQPGKGGGYE